jgi:Flp pilus assembly protein TadD
VPPAGYAAQAAALAEAGQTDEAEALLADALSRFPDDREAAVQYAGLANRRGGWEEAVERWDAVRQRFPDEIIGYWAAAQALRQLRRFGEAEALLLQAMERLPDHPEPLVEYALIAHELGDWPEAIRRWEAVRQRLPDRIEGYVVAAEALAQARRFEEAEVLVGEGRRHFPDNPLAFSAAAGIAGSRGDWVEAVARWSEAVARFPNEAEFPHRLFEARLWLTGSEPAAVEPAAPGAAAAAELQQLMMRFESLGSGCEFGDVQRRCGAEPLGLLRWASIGPAALAAAIDTGFVGIGDPETKELTTPHIGGRETYWLTDRRLGIEMHTFVPADQVPPEQMLAEACRRLDRLAAKLIEDLREGEKIFVYRSDELSGSDAEILHAAIRRVGNGTLLCVRRGDADHPPGTIETPAPGLMIGYLERFAETLPDGRLDVPAEAWIDLCRKADKLHRVGSVQG